MDGIEQDTSGRRNRGLSDKVELNPSQVIAWQLQQTLEMPEVDDAVDAGNAAITLVINYEQQKSASELENIYALQEKASNII